MRSRRSDAGPFRRTIQEWAFRGGLAAILMLMLTVTFNDLGAFGLVDDPARVDRLTQVRQGGPTSFSATRNFLRLGVGCDSDQSFKFRSTGHRRAAYRHDAGRLARGRVRADHRSTDRPGRADDGSGTPAAVPIAAPVTRTIKTLRVEDSQRLEPETVLSYTKLRSGQAYTNETLDQALKGSLIASDLFADVIDQRRRKRRHRPSRPRESGDQPRDLRGQQALEGRQDQEGGETRPSPDLHAHRRPPGCRADHRTLSSPGPLRRRGRTEDGQSRPESRRRDLRSVGGTEIQGPPDQHPRQRPSIPTTSCASRWRPSRRA